MVSKTVDWFSYSLIKKKKKGKTCTVFLLHNWRDRIT